MSLPTILGPLVVWRHWSLEEDGRLKPWVVNVLDAWKPREVAEAQCGMRRRFETGTLPFPSLDCWVPAPHLSPDCRICGLYGLKRYRWREFRDVEGFYHCASGLAALWGRVAVHESGYRAQFGYPLHIFVTRRVPREPAAACSRLYGIPVERIKFGRFWWQRRRAEKRVRRELMLDDSLVKASAAAESSLFPPPG